MEQTESIFKISLPTEPDEQFVKDLDAAKKGLLDRKVKKIDWTRMPKDVRVISRYNLMYYHDGNGNFRTLPTWEGDCAILDDVKISLASEQPIVPWFGGEKPVPEGVNVMVWLRNGERDVAMGSKIYWKHKNNNPLEIILFKIIGLAEGWTA